VVLFNDELVGLFLVELLAILQVHPLGLCPEHNLFDPIHKVFPHFPFVSVVSPHGHFEPHHSGPGYFHFVTVFFVATDPEDVFPQSLFVEYLYLEGVGWELPMDLDGSDGGGLF